MLVSPPTGRAGVRVKKSRQAILLERHQRAVELEKHLNAVANSTTTTTTTTEAGGRGVPSTAAKDDKLNQLRLQLCELLSDFILFDADFSRRENVVERLWRHCFYSRLVPLRNRIAKEKRKAAAPATSANHHHHQSPLFKWEQSLQFFLTEAITLYDYLCEKLVEKLRKELSLTQEAGSGHRAHSKADGEEEDDDDDDDITMLSFASGPSLSQDPSASTSTVGIVECLHRLSIHLGDLYRYSNNLGKAELLYTKATELGPGHGHAYNQLAVVCQLRDQQGSSPLSAVALYWYARAVMTTHVPFETAKANLTRLLASNREWLQQQQLQQQETDKPSASTAPLSLADSTSTTQDPSRKGSNGSQPDLHYHKSIQSRLFLAQFVDLHYHFIQGLEPLQMASVMTAMDQTMQVFGKMLQSSGLGDGLLCKMVLIQAFSEHYWGRRPWLATKKSAPTESIWSADLTGAAARTATLCLGHQLAERVAANLAKLEASHKGGSSNNKPSRTPSVRLLSPLLLVTEYVEAHSTRNSRKNNTESEQEMMIWNRLEQAEQEFWSAVLEVVNQLQTLSRHWNSGQPTGGDEVEAESIRPIKEYQGFRGFAPLESILGYEKTEAGLVSDMEAVAIWQPPASPDPRPLERTGHRSQDASTVHSSSTTAASTDMKSNSEQSRIKVSRFLALRKRLMSDPTSYLGQRVQTKMRAHGRRELVWVGAPSAAAVVDDDDQQMDYGGDDEDARNGDDVQVDEEDGDEEDGDEEVMAYSKEYELTSNKVGDTHEMEVEEAGDDDLKKVDNPPIRDRSTLEKKDGGILVYKMAAGGGPALLVPGALLQSMEKSEGTPQAKADAVPSAAAVTSAAGLGALEHVVMQAQHHLQSAAPSVKPPPGFAMQQFAPVASNVTPGQMPTASTMNVLVPSGLQVGLGAVSPSVHRDRTVAESIGLFGSLETANPFASMPRSTADEGLRAMPTTGFGPHLFHAANNFDGFLADDLVGTDGSVLLDSSLLKSLIMKENLPRKSKNPFLT